MRILLLLLLLSGLRLGANGSDTDNVPRPGNGTVTGEGNSSSSDSPAFWPSFSLFFRDHHKETPKDDDDHRHDWHKRYFHRFLPLVGIVVLALVATCLCLGYACVSLTSTLENPNVFVQKKKERDSEPLIFVLGGLALGHFVPGEEETMRKLKMGEGTQACTFHCIAKKNCRGV
ncbi:uncharacterized protein ISCGN_025156 [Ixodes scapularis]